MENIRTDIPVFLRVRKENTRRMSALFSKGDEDEK